MPKITFVPLENNEDSIPQAIFWRPLVYFASSWHAGEDELDRFEAAYFCIGNRLRFSLRRYNGYPAFTSTLYIGLDFVGDDLTSAIDDVISGFRVPTSSVGWRRGDAFEFGQLHRSPTDRLREKEARNIVLKIAALCHNHTATTSYVKRRVPEIFPLSEADKQRSPTRGREQVWQQIVGNVKVHGDSGQGLFTKGYAEPTPTGLTVTEKGLDYLRGIGFQP